MGKVQSNCFFSQELFILAVSEAALSGGEHEFAGYES